MNQKHSVRNASSEGACYPSDMAVTLRGHMGARKAGLPERTARSPFRIHLHALSLGVGVWARNRLQVRTTKFVTITEFSSFSVTANKLWMVHFKHFKNFSWTSLEVQWLRLCTSISGGVGLIPGQGTGVPHAVWPKRE